MGGKIPSALSTVQYQTLLSPEQPEWLTGHRLPPHIVFPATGYLELALAAGRQLLHSDRLTVQDLNIRQALFVDSRISLQTLLEPEGSGYRFRIASCPEARQHQGPWIHHAEGVLKLGSDQSDETPATSLAVNAMSVDSTADIQAYYQNYREQGLDYGPSFQCIRSLSVQNNTVTGILTLAVQEQHHAHRYLLHPALLDSCLQLLKAALPEGNSQRYLPVALDQLNLYRSGADAAYCQATLTGPTADSADYYNADLKIYDREGRPVAELKQLMLRPVSAEQLSGQHPRPLDSYRIIWQNQPLSDQTQSQSQNQARWLLFIEPGDLAEQLKSQLPNSHRISSGNDYQNLDARHTQLDPTQPEHYRRLLLEHPDAVGIVHAWSETQPGLEADLEHSADPDSLIAKAQQRSCGSVLLLIQALASTPAAQPRSLTLITRGAQAVYRSGNENTGDNETALQTRLNPLQAPLLGLAKVIVLEHPEHQCLRIDLDPDAQNNGETEARYIAEELYRQTRSPLNSTGSSPAAEDQIAYRQGQRYVPRLQKRSGNPAGTKPTDTTHPNTAPQRRLQLNGYGIDQLQLVETPAQAPAAGHLQISVTASGLNFKDILHALGMLNFPGCQPEAIPFGFECAGTVSQIGEGCQGFNIGDRVMAVLTPGSMADHVNVDARYVIKTPSLLSDSQAAAIPLAYLTASYGLEQLAAVKPGETILIHAAAGGVGQAAIQIAQHHNLDIHASAHPDKWPMLEPKASNTCTTPGKPTTPTPSTKPPAAKASTSS